MLETKLVINSKKQLKLNLFDFNILSFLDRIGYATNTQIINFTNATAHKINGHLNKLLDYNFIKIFNSHVEKYYALGKNITLCNKNLKSIKLDQLEHHDFLTNLFINFKNESIQTERELISQYKKIGGTGKIPDMIINNIVIEYERTLKNTELCATLIHYWTIIKNMRLCIIYANQNIKNRYLKITNNDDIYLIAHNDIYTQGQLFLNPTNHQKSENKYTAELLLNKYR